MTGAPESARDFDETEVARYLQRLLASNAFAKTAGSRRLLEYLIQRRLQGAEGPKETEIAIDLFGRGTTFHGGDDSVVRVTMRGLRQKLLEYYSGEGRTDPLIFSVPKGSYRLKVAHRSEVSDGNDLGIAEVPKVISIPPMVPPTVAESRSARPAFWRNGIAVGLGLLLAVSVATNVVLWTARGETDSTVEQVRRSVLWHDIAVSDRPVMIVLGDIFMYTQADPVTGRLQTVRDPQIDSSEDLRAFLASNPSLVSARGQRSATYIQKSTAVGMATVIPIVGRPGRHVEVRLRDELRAEDLGRYDIVYVGPFSRMGPLEAIIHDGSHYHFEASSAGVTDAISGKLYLPEGDLADHRKDYALVSSFRSPQGTRIVIITAGGRNAGLGQVVRTVTSPEGLAVLERKLQASGTKASGTKASGAFEALLAVAGYRQTDLSAEVVDARRL